MTKFGFIHSLFAGEAAKISQMESFSDDDYHVTRIRTEAVAHRKSVKKRKAQKLARRRNRRK